MTPFDIIIIGAGVGGYVTAIRASQLGLKVAIVEKSTRLGGTCLNVGCIPSKAMLESSELYHLAQHDFARHGIATTGLSVDLPAMLARKHDVVTQLTDGVRGLMKKNRVQVFEGRARLAGPGKILVDGHDEPIETAHIVLATGSVPVELPFLPFDGERVVSSTEALSFERVPKRLVVVGAGAVGLELGSVWRRLGAEVTIVEFLPRILPFADKTIASQLQRFLKAQGLVFELGAKVTGADVSAEGVTVHYTDRKGNDSDIACDKVLVAVGRRPYTAGLGLETVGIETDRAGRVPIDGAFQTKVPGIYALGDLVEGPMLAHKAEEEAVALAELIAGKPGHVDAALIPSIVYTDPELAAVGLTEQEAKDQGLSVRVGRFLFRANGRALGLGQTDGSVKIVADAKTDRLLGVHIVGPRASELIAEAVLAMAFHGSAEDLARTVHAHPTLSEALKEAALDVEGRAIHA